MRNWVEQCIGTLVFALSCSNSPSFTEVLFCRDCLGRFTLPYPNTRNVFRLGRTGRRAKHVRIGAGCVIFDKSLNLSGLPVSPRSNEGVGHLILAQLSRIHSSPWLEVQSLCKNCPNQGKSRRLGESSQDR